MGFSHGPHGPRRPHWHHRSHLHFYQYCRKCGCKKKFDTFPTCMNCKRDMDAHKKFNVCKRCKNPKELSINGLCTKCQQEVTILNIEARYFYQD